MQPSNLEQLGQASGVGGNRRPQVIPSTRGVIRSAVDGRRPRSEDSWIEVSSQPSSSSLSSAATDEIVTTGLRLHHEPIPRRRRRPRPNAPNSLNLSARPRSAAGSSQEEYEESESESDRVLSSSNEILRPSPAHPNAGLALAVKPSQPSSSASDFASSEDDDEDTSSTALGVTNTEPVFTPQPNAFSHPPSSTRQTPQAPVPGSYFPAPRMSTSRSAPQRHSYPSQRSRHHTPYNMISPSYQADHDAALRASLSTLLSCAAAARGLPKRDTAANGAGASNRAEPSTMRMVPESVVMGEENTQHTQASPRRPSGSSSNKSFQATSIQDKGKRKASTSKDRRATKKSRRSGTLDEFVSPTMLTWVVSAGVVVLFSAISFSAGYAMGKEVGRAEVSLGPAGTGGTCGKEVGRGLRRLRWGSSSATIRV